MRRHEDAVQQQVITEVASRRGVIVIKSVEQDPEMENKPKYAKTRYAALMAEIPSTIAVFAAA
jgi:hypothetical protein